MDRGVWSVVECLDEGSALAECSSATGAAIAGNVGLKLLVVNLVLRKWGALSTRF